MDEEWILYTFSRFDITGFIYCPDMEKYKCDDNISCFISLYKP